tara:strand:+ start:6012 stop:6476 length:465 start_codon:yes stop_codon:yes gene_type:complete
MERSINDVIITYCSLIPDNTAIAMDSGINTDKIDIPPLIDCRVKKILGHINNSTTTVAIHITIAMDKGLYGDNIKECVILPNDNPTNIYSIPHIIPNNTLGGDAGDLFRLLYHELLRALFPPDINPIDGINIMGKIYDNTILGSMFTIYYLFYL